MQVSVEKVSTVERRLTISIPADLVEEAYHNKLKDFVKSANIKGFRPGKVPVSYIQKRFGGEARQEALSEQIEKALFKAIADEKLKPVSTPKVEPKAIQPNQPVEFVASFEVLPDIEEVNFVLEKLEKLNVDIKEEDVNQVVQHLKKQYTEWNVVERPAENGDRVVIDYVATFEGSDALDNKAQNFTLELGSKRMFPGFEEGLVGLKAGDEKQLSLTFPADFADKEKANKPIEFTITVKQVFAAKSPELDESFIKKLGIQSGKEEDFTKQIKQSLELERDRLVKEKIKEQLFNALLDQNPLEVPQSLVAREAKSIHDELYRNQKHDHQNHSEDEMSAFNEIAKKRVALGLLINEYARLTKLTADKDRVYKRIQEIASSYEKPEDVVNWLKSPERLSGIEAQILEDQVMEKLMEKTTVSEKDASYAELKGVGI